MATGPSNTLDMSNLRSSLLETTTISSLEQRKACLLCSIAEPVKLVSPRFRQCHSFLLLFPPTWPVLGQIFGRGKIQWYWVEISARITWKCFFFLLQGQNRRSVQDGWSLFNSYWSPALKSHPDASLRFVSCLYLVRVVVQKPAFLLRASGCSNGLCVCVCVCVRVLEGIALPCFCLHGRSDPSASATWTLSWGVLQAWILCE